MPYSVSSFHRLDMIKAFEISTHIRGQVSSSKYLVGSKTNDYKYIGIS